MIRATTFPKSSWGTFRQPPGASGLVVQRDSRFLCSAQTERRPAAGRGAQLFQRTALQPARQVLLFVHASALFRALPPRSLGHDRLPLAKSPPNEIVGGRGVAGR